MIHKPTTVHLSMMTTGIVAVFAVLLLLPTPSARAAGNAQPVKRPMASRVAPAGAYASHAARVDPRIAEFNRELAAYKQTVTALQRDTQRLMKQQRYIDALVNEIGKNAELNMIQLQSIMSQRQTAIQLTSNLMKALNDSENQVIHNMK
jgi:hypothetical protein